MKRNLYEELYNQTTIIPKNTILNIDTYTTNNSIKFTINVSLFCFFLLILNIN